jgi:hypothetical protein
LFVFARCLLAGFFLFLRIIAPVFFGALLFRLLRGGRSVVIAFAFAICFVVIDEFGCFREEFLVFLSGRSLTGVVLVVVFEGRFVVIIARIVLRRRVVGCFDDVDVAAE